MKMDQNNTKTQAQTDQTNTERREEMKSNTLNQINTHTLRIHRKKRPRNRIKKVYVTEI